MKPAMKIFIILFLFGISTSFAQSNELKIRVDGLSCPFCAYGLEKKLNDIDGVENIYIDIDEGVVTLQVNEEDKISPEEIREKIKEAGFTPKEIVFSNKEDKTEKKE